MQTVTLAILDGVGIGRQDIGDAVFLAKTPHLDKLLKNNPWGTLQAHGTAVGLPSDGDMGNSEVGHNAMGAGRVFDQGAKLINQAIENGSIWESHAWKQAMNTKTLHLLGLLSDGNVHSHIDHLFALLDRAKQENKESVAIHILTDGRDVHPISALSYIDQLEAKLASLGPGYFIASGGGRMEITMDRYEADWPMVKRGWDCHVHGQARIFESAREAVEKLYAEDPK
ncbi:MAG: phosphoglycerate mutase (2,3-diphosphoglycerate-independent), partial [Proteobacteria bacterium]|nr:phosphoglycerate mutase (2,3-diphosphoglycerate-independent) [Pseudomonadota bacterium]